MKEKHSTLLLIFVIAFGATLSVSSWLCFWADSEIWALRSSDQLFYRFNSFSFSPKILFHSFLYGINRISLNLFDNLDPLFLSRLIFSFNALLITFLTGKITFFFTKSTKASLLTALFVLCDTFFTTRGFRIRSDLLATSMFLILTLHLFQTPKNLSREKLLAIGVLYLLPLLFTLKAAYLSLTLIIILTTNKSKRFNKETLTTIASTFFVLIILVLSIDPIKRAFFESWSYFLRTFSKSEVGFSYFDPQRFEYIIQWLLHNSVKLSLFALSFVIVIFQPFRQIPHKLRPELKSLALISLATILIMLLHPSRLPFFIAAYSPIFSILAAILAYYSLQFIEEKWSSSISYIALLLLILVIILPSMKLHQRIIISHTNTQQNETMGLLNKYLQNNPQANVFDSIGISKNSLVKPWFIGQGERHKRALIIKKLSDSPINLILYTKKFNLFNPEIGLLLNRSYIPWNNGAFVRSITIPFTNGQLPLSSIQKQVQDKWPQSNKMFIQSMYIYDQVKVSTKHVKHTNKSVSIKFQNVTKKDTIKFKNSSGQIKVSLLVPPRFPYLINDLFRFDSEL